MAPIPAAAAAVDGRWALGVGLAFLNNFVSSLGFALQRKSVLLRVAAETPPSPVLTPQSCPGGAPPEERQVSGRGKAGDVFWSCPPTLLWALGVAVYISAALPDVLAYALAPEIVCCTIGCTRLVIMACLAHALLGERVGVRESLGVALCTAGTIMCLWFGPTSKELADEVTGPEDIFGFKVVVYLGASGFLLLVLTALEHFDKLHCVLPSSTHHLVLPFLTALAFCVEKVFNTEAGYVGVQSNVGGVVWTDWRWNWMLVMIGLLGVCDFYFNIRGVQKLPVQVFVPTAFGFNTCIQYFQAAVVLEEFENVPTLHVLLSMVGAMASLVGALAIQPMTLEQDGQTRGPQQQKSLLVSVEEDSQCSGGRSSFSP